MSDKYTSKYKGREIDNAVEKVNKSIPAQIADLQANKADRTELPKTVADLGFNENKYIVEIEESSASSDVAKRYIIKQGDIGLNVTIDIPKDMVVSSGTVETYTDDDKPEDVAEAGTYIVLTIANSAKDKLYIKANTLVEGLAPIAYVNEELAKKADKTLIERIKYYGDPDIVPSDESYFTVNDTGETITGLSEAGKAQTKLVIPYKINGKEITTLYSGSDGIHDPPVSILDGNSTITKVVIPKSVTTLGGAAFYGRSSLTSIDIPNNVTNIGSYAFGSCTSLVSINIPNSVINIGINSFINCSSLTSINIPNSVTYIGSGAFEGCTVLTSINIPNSVTSIRYDTFNRCENLTSINIPNSVTSIEAYAFSGCPNLTIYCEQGSYAETYAKANNIPVVYTDVSNIATETELERLKYYGDKDIVPSDESWFTISDDGSTIMGLTTVGKNQTDIIIPYKINGNIITTIESGAFYGKSSIQTIIIPNSIINMHSNIFSGCHNLNSVNIPNGITIIEAGTFRGCRSLTTINLPNTIQMIDSLAFSGCTSLVSINIPKDTTQIGYNTFENCTSLTSIIIPKTVTFIGNDAFNNSPNLTIYCEQGSCADTYAKANNIPVAYTDIKDTILDNKADKATTLDGYGITDAYTKDEVDSKISSVYTFAGSRTVEELNSYDMSHLPETTAPIPIYNVSVGGRLEGIARTNLGIEIVCITSNPGEAYFRLSDYESDSAKLAVGDILTIHGVDIPELTITSISGIDYYASYSGDYNFGSAGSIIVIDEAKGASLNVSPGDNIALTPAGWDKLASTVDLSRYQTKLMFDAMPIEFSNNPVTSDGIAKSIGSLSGKIDAGLASKQDKLTFDETPTAGSNNPVTSGGIYDAIANASGNENDINELKVTVENDHNHIYNTLTPTVYDIEEDVNNELKAQSYGEMELNSEFNGVAKGLCKFTFTGLVQPGRYNPCHGNVVNTYVPLLRTIGNIIVNYYDGNSYSMPIDLYGRNEDTEYGFSEAKDELTEKYYKRVWSKDFFLSLDQEYKTNEDLGITLGNSSNKLHVFTIPASAFGDELPKKTGVIQAISPMSYPCTKDWMINYTTAVALTWTHIAMDYDSDNNSYNIYFLTNNITKKQLLNSKVYVKYELENPVYDYHVPKIYAQTMMSITFEQKMVDIIPGVLKPSSQSEISRVPITADIRVPMNTYSALESFEQTAINLNDLNKRVDNIETVSAKLGAADGSTDDSDVIQNIIDNCETTSGHITTVVIPEGVYALGKSINLTRSNIRLVGDGNVILKPTGNFPAIKVYRPSASKGVTDIFIDNFKIYLPNAAYMDGSFEGSHSGIYIDGNYGLYRINISNITVQGIYRNAVEDTDHSYGIYYKDNDTNGYVYFPTLDNINAFSLYCGLYLGKRANCFKITNYHYDRGTDIYGYGGLPFTTFGCAYGVICKSSYNFIDFSGQSIGDDTTSWCYKDNDFNVYPLADVIGSENVNTNTTLSIDYFASGYKPSNRTTITVGGETIDLFIARKNLTKANIWCSGIGNYFVGHVFDPQRTDTYYHFTAESRENRYYYACAYDFAGSKYVNTSTYVDFYGDGSSNYCNMFVAYVIDAGYENQCMDTVLAEDDIFVSDNYICSADGNNATIGHSKHFGMQDNALAYADKRSSVRVYQSVDGAETDVTVNGVPAVDVISDVFDPKSCASGFRNGITFDQIPTQSEPIYIDIEFNDGFEIEYLSRFGIKFNDYIGSDISIMIKTSDGKWTNNYIGSNTIFNKNSQFSFIAYTVANDGSIKTWEHVKGIRIVLKGAFNTAVYNTEKKVGISSIWATDASHGGNAWMPRGGGEMYGDVSMNNNRISDIAAPENDNDAATKAYIDDKLQNIDTALDNIIAIQQSLIGGDTV